MVYLIFLKLELVFGNYLFPGAFALDVLQVLIEGRGASWSIGGQQTWRNFLTLPNILKVFNPKLYGFSTDSAISVNVAAKFNVAEPGVRKACKQ